MVNNERIAAYLALKHRSCLTFKEIADNHLLSPDMSPVETMQWLVQAFLRGELEWDGKSKVFRTDLAPDSPAGSSISYGYRADGIIVKSEGKDERYLTADRRYSTVERRDFVKLLPDDYMPSPWDGTEQGLQGIATAPLTSWPEKTRLLYFEKWCVEADALKTLHNQCRSGDPADIQQIAPLATQEQIEAYLIEQSRKNGDVIPARDKYWPMARKYFKENIREKTYRAAHDAVKENSKELSLSVPRTGAPRKITQITTS